MAKDAGYWQAIDNLAFYVRKLSLESQVPIFMANPWLVDESEEFQIEFCTRHQTEEQQQQWAQLDKTYFVIMETYDVPYEEVYNDALARSIQYDLEAGTV